MRLRRSSDWTTRSPSSRCGSDRSCGDRYRPADLVNEVITQTCPALRRTICVVSSASRLPPTTSFTLLTSRHVSTAVGTPPPDGNVITGGWQESSMLSDLYPFSDFLKICSASGGIVGQMAFRALTSRDSSALL